MVFSQPTFLFLFLPIVLGLYALAPRSAKNALLLGASLLFYSWGEEWLVLVMLASIGVNYRFGRWLERLGAAEGVAPSSRDRTSHADKAEQANLSRQRWVVALAVAFNLALLVALKYAVWLLHVFAEPIRSLGFDFQPPDSMPPPIGISFFTFQAISYVVDVYRGQAQAQRRVLDFALYIALFPQLIAGPIVRYRDIARQIQARTTRFSDFAEGCRRFIFGLAKKVVIADTMSAAASKIFEIPGSEITMPLAWVGLIFYGLHLYFDFSGYSDMAIGLGRMFGFRLLENFNYPYISSSVTEFWVRWHISLSSWFRDYLYIPLGGNKKGAFRTYLNLMLVFVLCGLWHGAAGVFLVFGLYHGGFLILERVGLGRALGRIPRPFRHVYAMVAVMLSFTVFRATSLADAAERTMPLFLPGTGDSLRHPLALYVETKSLGIAAIGILLSTPVYPLYLRWRGRAHVAAGGVGDLLELTFLAAAVAATWMLLSVNTFTPFLYFRF